MQGYEGKRERFAAAGCDGFPLLGQVAAVGPCVAAVAVGVAGLPAVGGPVGGVTLPPL